MADTAPEPIPAATLIVMREGDGGAPEILMVERSSAMRFAGGALVFPGGRVDPGDFACAAAMAGDRDEAAARIAAIRETIEEAGLAIGVRGNVDVEGARHALYAGTPIAEVLGHEALNLDQLVPFSRWLPHAGVSHRVFDTRFYLAAWPKGAGEPVADGNESVRLLWTTARHVLAEADAGRARVIYPTRRNLERIAQFATYADAVADARAHPVTTTITPWIETRDGMDHLCIPEGLGYPVTAEPLTGVLRA